MSPPEIWSPTLNWAGLKSHEIPRSSACVLIPPTRLVAFCGFSVDARGM
jgi:hypothetical protein